MWMLNVTVEIVVAVDPLKFEDGNWIHFFGNGHDTRKKMWN